MPDKPIRLDYRIIAALVPAGASILDLGCGDGELMFYLAESKRVRGRGIEIDEQAIYRCVGRGLSVAHQDLDDGLTEYGDRSFDVVILNQCLQQVQKPQTVIAEAVRVGKQAIIGFPNFAHFSARWQLGVRGRVPVTPALPYQWFDTPNRHFLSLRDFISYCAQASLIIERALYLSNDKKVRLWPGMLAQSGIFLISKK